MSSDIRIRTQIQDVYKRQHIACFIQSLVRLMGTVDEYLLDPSNLVVEMAYIFGAGSEWAYVYIPGYGEDFWRQMEKLSEEWLNYVDYSNEKAVLWAYTFYQKVHGENCSAEELMDILAMECLLPEPNAAVVQEEIGAWPAEAAGENVGRKWTHRLAEKIKKMIYGRRKNNPDICCLLYTSANGISVDSTLWGGGVAVLRYNSLFCGRVAGVSVVFSKDVCIESE